MDYRDMNPIFWDTVGEYRDMLRGLAGFWIAADAPPQLLVSYVDQGRFFASGYRGRRCS